MPFLSNLLSDTLQKKIEQRKITGYDGVEDESEDFIDDYDYEEEIPPTNLKNE